MSSNCLCPKSAIKPTSSCLEDSDVKKVNKDYFCCSHEGKSSSILCVENIFLKGWCSVCCNTKNYQERKVFLKYQRDKGHSNHTGRFRKLLRIYVHILCAIVEGQNCKKFNENRKMKVCGHT